MIDSPPRKLLLANFHDLGLQPHLSAGGGVPQECTGAMLCASHTLLTSRYGILLSADFSRAHTAAMTDEVS